MNKSSIYKVIAVVGATASGKSKFAIEIAKSFNGEIINADSRQIYKFLNIGTAKDPDDNLSDEIYTVEGIRHHLIDFVDPKENFSVAEFQKLAWEKIKDVTSRKKLPILVGGTGLWIDAVCNPNYVFEGSEANWNLRKNLEEKSVEELFDILKKLNEKVSKELNESDAKNPVRLIRLIEKEKQNSLIEQTKKNDEKFISIDALYISPKVTLEELEQRIYHRVDKMFKDGLIDEVKSLIKEGYKFSDPGLTGIGYKEFEEYFRNDSSEYVMIIEKVKDEIKLRTRQYAKRQITWFKRNKNIKYVNLEEARSLVEKHLSY